MLSSEKREEGRRDVCRDKIGRPIYLPARSDWRNPPLDAGECLLAPVRQLELKSEQKWPTVSESTVAPQTNFEGTPWSIAVKTRREIKVSNGEGNTNEKDGPKDEGKTTTTPSKKYARQPLMLEIGSMIETIKAQKGSLSIGGAGVTPQRVATVARVSQPANPLDSSAPNARRGKERETPKRKKPSSLRKVIEKEKEERKVQRESGQLLPATRTGPPHSRKFREYCTHMPSEDINDTVRQLLSDLVRFQDRQFLKDPTKAKAKRRYICGLREVKKHVELCKIKCVIVAPDLDSIQSPGGIDDTVQDLLSLCQEQGVVTMFALSRRQLGFLTRKKHKVGCIGIFSYDGAELCYKKLMELVLEARDQYVSVQAADDHTLTDSSPPDPCHQTPSQLSPSNGMFEFNAMAPAFVPSECLFSAFDIPQ